MGKREHRGPTGDFPILMPRRKPLHHGPHRWRWLLLALVIVALIAWRLAAYLIR